MALRIEKIDKWFLSIHIIIYIHIIYIYRTLGLAKMESGWILGLCHPYDSTNPNGDVPTKMRDFFRRT